ncbi:transcriptional regulator [Vibrio cholerae]|nr:transcriptional regulator [Vibrio cholerae]EGR3866297.1 transcriptional regulator [Vibrio cholerae]PAR90248.1 transcriptional regulator [Vibrio cholerae]TQO84445.1 transcriptional regulator [Vibrio cholerae]TQO96743.1 transcriptional regulator [Vibrio cholerae]
MSIILQISVHFQAGQGSIGKLRHNKRLKRDCQRAAFPVPLSRGGCSCCV